MTAFLMGKRILVVEDEYFIASDLKRALQREGAVVVGPVGDLAKGLALAAGEGIDAAILDVNLAGAPSLAIADALAARAVPFMFLTGYDKWALPDAYQAVPRVGKPFSIRAVLACVERLIGVGVTGA